MRTKDANWFGLVAGYGVSAYIQKAVWEKVNYQCQHSPSQVLQLGTIYINTQRYTHTRLCSCLVAECLVVTVMLLT